MLASASLRRSTALTSGVLAALLTVLLSPQPLHAQNVWISLPQRGADGARGIDANPVAAAEVGGDGVAGYRHSQSGKVTVDARVTGGTGGTGGANHLGGAGANGGAGGAGLLVTQ